MKSVDFRVHSERLPLNIMQFMQDEDLSNSHVREQEMFTFNVDYFSNDIHNDVKDLLNSSEFAIGENFKVNKSFVDFRGYKLKMKADLIR